MSTQLILGMDDLTWGEFVEKRMKDGALENANIRGRLRGVNPRGRMRRKEWWEETFENLVSWKPRQEIFKNEMVIEVKYYRES